MKKIQFLPLVCCLTSLLWLFTQCATAQGKTPPLAEQDRVSLLEMRHGDLKKEIDENQTKLEKKIDDRLDLEQKRIEDTQDEVGTILAIMGVIGTIFGLILPVILFVIGYKWFKDIEDEKKNIEKLKEEIKETKQTINATKEAVEATKKEADTILDQIKQKKAATDEATQELSKITQNLLLGQVNLEEVKKIADDKDVEPFAHHWAEVVLLFHDTTETKSESNYKKIITDVQAILDKYADKIAFRYLADLYFIIAYSHGQLGKPIQAYNYFDTVTTLLPNNALAWNNKGFALALLGDCEKDEGDKAKSKNKDKDAIEKYEQAKAKYKEAIECYDKAIEIEKEHLLAWNNKGNALAKLGDLEKQDNKPIQAKEKYEEAIKCYDKAIDKQYNYFFGWFNKGNALAKLGDLENEAGNKTQAKQKYEEAIKCLEKAKAIAKDNNDKELIEKADNAIKEQEAKIAALGITDEPTA